MGLRRTPPPGMAAPPPPKDYMTEFPEQQQQQQPEAQVQVEATPTATPVEAPAVEASPAHTSQAQSSSQVAGTPVDADSAAGVAAISAASTPVASSAPGATRSTRSAASTPAPARNSPPIKSAPVSATPTPPPAPAAEPEPEMTPAPPAATTSPQSTPQQNLLTLAAGLNRPPTTPHHLRPYPSTRRTPGAHRLAPKLTARSPHAIRAFTRRAATPARRKSGRYNPPARESPRDWLLKLSGILAPTTAPFVPTPVQTPRVLEEGMYFSDPGEEDEERPRTSINFYEDGEEDGELPARPDTAKSVERGRRAVSEQPWGGRVSFGITWDDRFADLDALREQGGDEEAGETTQLADVSMGVGEVTMGGISVGDESTAGRERMGFVPEDESDDDEDGDVTMGIGGEELPFDEGDSYFIPMPTEEDGPAPAQDAEDEDEDDEDTGLPMDYDEDDDATATAPPHRLAAATASAPRPQKPKRKALPLSRHGHPLPPFPRATIKKLAQTFAGGAAIGSEALEAVVKASDAFWEQVSEDLAAYSGHAGRKTIEEGDVVVLMRRQRQITEGATLFSLAQRHLPRELLQQVKMPLVKPARGGKRKGKAKAVEVDGGEGEET